MDFKDISIEDRQDVEEAWRKAGIIDCDLAFANLICWSDSTPAQICRVDGYIVVRVLLDKKFGWLYTLPICIADYNGNCDDSHILKMIEEEIAANGTAMNLLVPSEAAIEKLRKRYPDFGFFYQRNNSDYIYSREALTTLHGKKLQSKRNHLNKFKASYDFSYSSLSANDRAECFDLLHIWRERRITEGNVPDSFIEELDKEESSIRRAFDNFEALSIIGGVLRVDGKIIAFCYGSALSEDTVCVHIEKGDETYEGVFAAINQQFAEHLPEGFKYVNRENDLGLQGLRHAKESYHPERILNKYIGVKMTEQMLQIKKLWLDCFVHDTPLDVEEFLITRFKEEMMLSHRIDGQLVAMLHIIPFGQTAYLYAISTDPNYRHRGIAGRLIQEALAKCKSMGFARAALIPDNKMAAEWYAGMGFSGMHPAIFNTRDEFDFFAICDDYDFGKCDGTPDLAMIYPFTSVDSLPDSPLILSDL